MSDPWFKPKKFGYGSGLPCSWQGWVLIIGYMLLVTVASFLLERRPLALMALMVPATILLLVVAAKTTEGGWRWRSGGDE